MLDIVGAKFIREVENGEIVVIENEKISSINLFQSKNRDHVFLNIFILLDLIALSTINVHMNIEKNLGSELAKETDLDADLVIPVPDSGVPAALGFAEQSKKFEVGFNQKPLCGPYIYRTNSKYKEFRCEIKIKYY